MLRHPLYCAVLAFLLAGAPPAHAGATASADVPAAGEQPAMSRAQIREAQALLGALGYRPGPADGVWGGRTAAAHKLFLRAAGLPPSDGLTPESLRALRVQAKSAGVGA